MTAYRTSWPTPWALIRRGGQGAAGCRPPTRRAFITRAIAEHGKIQKLKCILCDENWRQVSQERDLYEADIVRQWHKLPQSKTVEKAKRSLPKNQDLEAQS